jgi:hypothetical protein
VWALVAGGVAILRGVVSSFFTIDGDFRLVYYICNRKLARCWLVGRLAVVKPVALDAPYFEFNLNLR